MSISTICNTHIYVCVKISKAIPICEFSAHCDFESCVRHAQSLRTATQRQIHSFLLFFFASVIDWMWSYQRKWRIKGSGVEARIVGHRTFKRPIQISLQSAQVNWGNYDSTAHGWKKYKLLCSLWYNPNTIVSYNKYNFVLPSFFRFTIELIIDLFYVIVITV